MSKTGYPITLQEAKRLARVRLGRLPRPGHSVVIGGVFTENRCDYQLDLVNRAGTFQLMAWERPFVTVDLSRFKTFEDKRDSRS